MVVIGPNGSKMTAYKVNAEMSYSVFQVTSIIHRLTNSSLTKNSLVYVVTDGINKAIPFLLLPFISRYLTPSDYGIISNYNVLIQILSVFVYLASAGILPVMYFRTDKGQLRRYISNMIILNSLVTMACLLVVLLCNNLIADGLQLPLGFQLLAIVSVWFASITNINLVLWRCDERPMAFGCYQISQSAINALSTVFFVIILLLGWQGRVYSMLLSCVLMGVLSLFVLYKRGFLVLKYSQEHFLKILTFGLPLVPHALSFWFKSGTDKILLTNMSGLTENGLYSVAMNWGAVVSLFLVAYSNSYSPWLYKKLAVFDRDKTGTLTEQRKLVKIIWLSLAMTFFAVSVIYVVSYALTRLIYPPSYYGSLDYLPMVMVSQAFNGAYLLFVCFCHYMLKTKILGVITFSLSLLQVLFTYLFILKTGPVGVAYSSAVVSFLTFVAVAAYGMQVYKLPWFDFMFDINNTKR